MEIKYDIHSPISYNLVFPFCVTIRGHDFPYDDWDDFIFSMMVDWILCLEKLKNTSHGKEKLYFMDGPYYILCEKQYEMVKISGHRDGDSNFCLEEVGEFYNLYQIVWQTAVEIINKISIIAPDVIDSNHNVHCLSKMVNRFLFH